MNKGKFKGFLRAIALCTVGASLLMTAACGKPADEKGRIAVICKSQGVSFWEDVRKGAEDAGNELGYDIDYYIASGDNDYASQVEFINEAISNKVKAIVIAPNGNAELDASFEKAENAGIKIININSRTDYEGVVSLVSSSDSDGGAVAARNAASLMLKANTEAGVQVSSSLVGKIGIVAHTAATADQRVAGFRSEFSAQLASYIERVKMNSGFNGGSGAPEKPEGEGQPAEGAEGEQMGPPAGQMRPEDQTAAMIESFIIEGERCSTIEAAYEEAKKLLNSNSDIKVMFATNTNTTLGVCQAIEELELSDSVIVVGFNSDEKELAYIRTGVLDGTIIQNPYNMGYVGVSYAIKSVDGEKLPRTLDTGVTFVDASNLNDDYIQLLLYPDKY